MKRTLKYALTAVLGAAMVVPAAAQSNFPDVPETHWAYRELARMKADGLLVGYPDGLFRGGRPASRYEMAVALHALYMRLKGVTDGLKTQIDEILAKLETKADKADLDNLRAAVAALQGQMGTVKQSDLDALRRLINEFGPELKTLGADVAKMKQDIADLDDRVSSLEKALPVAISGDINFLISTGYGEDGLAGVTSDGRATGVSAGGTSEGWLKNFSVFHEASVTLKNREQGDLNWSGTIVFGNTLGPAYAGGGLGTQSATAPGSAISEGPQAFYIQNLGVDFSGNVLGLGFNAKVGRIGYKVSPLIFQKADVTPFYSNSRWDSGEYTFDGANVKFGAGGVNFRVFGGRSNNNTSSNGDLVQSLMVGPTGTHPTVGGGFPFGNTANMNLDIDQFLGVHAKVGVGSGAVNLAYLFLNDDTVKAYPGTGGIDGAAVFGLDFSVPLGNFSFDAAYAQSNYMNGSKTRIDEDNSAWYANLGYKGGNFGVKVGYKSVLPQFGAPGDWGRIGYWYNPTDIEGFSAMVDVKLGEKLDLKLGGELYNGADEAVLGNTGFTNDDEITRYTVDLGYKLNDAFGIVLGYERVQVDLDGVAGTPRWNWFNIGTNWQVNNKAKLSFLWQISDVDNKGVGPVFLGKPQTKAKGGLITTQLSIKF